MLTFGVVGNGDARFELPGAGVDILPLSAGAVILPGQHDRTAY